MDIKNDYYVYVLLDSSKKGKYIYGDLKFNYEPFYIGKGIGDRINQTLYDKSPFKKNKINKLKSQDIEIISYKIYENLDNKSAIKIEKGLIKKIGRRDLNEGTLVNMTDGGDGRLNSNHPLSVRLKISESLKGVNIGRTHTKETIMKMSKSQTGENNGFYGNNHTDIVKKSHSDRVSGFNHPMYNKKHKDETIEFLKDHRKNNISNENIKEACNKFKKPVLMYDLKMNFIKEFRSVKEASISLDINESIISKCCRGDIIKPTRYYFKYKNTEDKIKNNKFLIPKDGKFKYDGNEYILKKRNKKTAICYCVNDNIEVIIHQRDFKYIFYKETNNSDIVELYLWLKNEISDVKLKHTHYGAIIYNNDIKVYYNKKLKSSEIFMDKNEILNRSGINIFEDEWVSKKDEVKLNLRSLLPT